jgi:hypothetical protein
VRGRRQQDSLGEAGALFGGHGLVLGLPTILQVPTRNVFVKKLERDSNLNLWNLAIGWFKILDRGSEYIFGRSRGGNLLKS